MAGNQKDTAPNGFNPDNTVKAPGGRPELYKRRNATQAGRLCKLGATDVNLAEFFDVSLRTITTWKGKHPTFLRALTKARFGFDNQVERSLAQRAMGFSAPEVDIRVINGEIVKTEIVKHYPPDTAACIFWLKNRRSNEWRDNQTHTLEAGKSIVDIYARMLDSEPEEAIKQVESVTVELIEGEKSE